MTPPRTGAGFGTAGGFFAAAGALRGAGTEAGVALAQLLGVGRGRGFGAAGFGAAGRFGVITRPFGLVFRPRPSFHLSYDFHSNSSDSPVSGSTPRRISGSTPSMISTTRQRQLMFSAAVPMAPGYGPVPDAPTNSSSNGSFTPSKC